MPQLDKAQEAQLFDHLFRHKPFSNWLADQLDRQVAILLVNTDPAMLAKTQGAAAFIKLVQDKLTAAENSAKR
jgi:hypothetical protein